MASCRLDILDGLRPSGVPQSIMHGTFVTVQRGERTRQSGTAALGQGGGGGVRGSGNECPQRPPRTGLTKPKFVSAPLAAEKRSGCPATNGAAACLLLAHFASAVNGYLEARS